jgi:hypothetical protein
LRTACSRLWSRISSPGCCVHFSAWKENSSGCRHVCAWHENPTPIAAAWSRETSAASFFWASWARRSTASAAFLSWPTSERRARKERNGKRRSHPGQTSLSFWSFHPEPSTISKTEEETCWILHRIISPSLRIHSIHV